MGSPPPIQFATLGMWDTLLLMVLALVVFGPRRLPMIGRQLGKLMYEFRKASNDFKFRWKRSCAPPKRQTAAKRRKKSASVPWPLLRHRRNSRPRPRKLPRLRPQFRPKPPQLRN